MTITQAKQGHRKISGYVLPVTKFTPGEGAWQPPGVVEPGDFGLTVQPSPDRKH